MHTLTSTYKFDCWIICYQRVLMEILLISTAISKNLANEPNVFFVTDDAPAGHRLGRLTHPDAYQNGAIDGASFQAVLVRANRPPAVFFKLDEHKGDLFTKVPMDREMLCSHLTQLNTNEGSFGNQDQVGAMVKSPNWNKLGPVVGSTAMLGSSSQECELKFQVALHRKASASLPGLPEFLDVRVVIMDRNDHVPTFHPHKFINLSIPESAQIGTRIRLPLAMDPDSPEFAIKQYKLFPTDQKEWVLYQQTNDVLYQGQLHHEIAALFLELRCALDREKKNLFVFEIKAYDSFAETTSSYDDRNTLKVHVLVEDINDNGPVFRPQSTKHPSAPDKLDISHLVTYRADIIETSWPKTPILKLEATDRDTMNFAIIRYEFAPQTDQLVRRYFKLNEHSGELYLRQPLDYETKSKFTFQVLAIDTEHERRMKLDGIGMGAHSVGGQADIYTSTAYVIVNVEDINDEAPVIELDYLRLEESTGRPGTFAMVQENSDPPQFVADLFVTDRDVNPMNNHLSEVRRQTGQVQYNLLTLRPLDREEEQTGGSVRRIHIVCVDSGTPSKTSHVTANVHVMDVNDNSPKIYGIKSHTSHSKGSSTIKLYENSAVGTLVARINVSDLDSGQNGIVTCKLVHPLERNSTQPSYADYFHVEPTTCDLVTRKVIDRESVEPYIERVVLTILAEDQGIPPKSTETKLEIVILDENDNPPILQQSYYRLSVKENLPAGTCIGQLVVHDLDGALDHLSARFQKHDDLPFQLWNSKRSQQPPDYGGEVGASVVYYLNTTRPLDREARESYEFNVLVIDGLEHSAAFRNELNYHRVHTTTATVFVLVEDENDNDPNIIFPQQENKTFYLSNVERQHYQLMTVNVNDKDSNAGQFLFSLVDETVYGLNQSVRKKDRDPKIQNRHTPFLDVDQRLGTVYLTRDVMETDTGLYAYKVTVEDDGSPPRSTSLRFFVRVEPTPPRSHRLHSLSTSDREMQMVSNNIERFSGAHTRIDLSNAEDFTSNKISEQKRSKLLAGFPRFTGDAVLILSLGLILLLLLATLCLIVYARHWNAPRFTRTQAEQEAPQTLAWFCTHLCDRDSSTGGNISKDFTSGKPDPNLKPSTSSSQMCGLNLPVQHFYAPDNVGTPQSHDTTTDILDDSTLQRIYTGDRIYYQECRPLTLIPVRSTSGIDSNPDGYTTLQTNTRYQTCTLPDRHRSPSSADERIPEVDTDLHSFSDPLNSNPNHYTPLVKRKQSPYRDSVMSSQPLRKKVMISSIPCCETDCTNEEHQGKLLQMHT
ncbi:cadherin domain protein [Opisthorchis viverrini]|uniref:Cadherin domain protein n=1 Tax=Opisthorchis viverrini TaxID=6198 RepID=A0A1S8X7T7_OPIVI|nr:cadherin domain protein [Opisthorchis viverrini]